MKQVIPVPGMKITESVQFVPGEYDFFEQEGLIIEGDGIIIDGCGAVLAGGHTKLSQNAEKGNTDEFGYESLQKADNARELGFFGTGILIDNKRNITIKNLTLKGFDIGALIEHSENITLENCDFSDCFTDPAWGWDDHGFHGGILMVHTHRSTIRRCKANRVWDALNMRYSHDNVIVENDFSHTSDTGLKLWNACRNLIEDNDFSYGIRIDPGEVHARDSSCVLIESGSNDNIFRRNNMTHGGDGLFIRVLNGWMSTGNLFEDNDCSYANNNAIEAWADNNTYIRNKANYSSYGFWLGNSDNTVLIGNEVAYNGGLYHNAPEAFGNAGIAVVNGSGSHYLLEGNYIHENYGPGIAIRYKKDYPSFHWIIQNNRIENNKDSNPYKGHGIYIKHARFLTFGKNEFTDNEGEDIYFDGNVSDVTYLEGGSEKQEPVEIKCDCMPIIAGKPVTFTVNEAKRIRWDLGDGTVCTGSSVTHTYKKSGFYRLAVTCDNGQQAALDFMNVYVCEDAPFLDLSPQAVVLSGEADRYECNMDEVWTVTGKGSLKVTAVGGLKHSIEWNISPAAFDDSMTLSGFFRYLTDTEPDWRRELTGPRIWLIQDEDNFIEYQPKFKLSDLFYFTEARNNWVKLRLDEDFETRETGKVSRINKIKIAIDSTSEGYTHIYFDGLCITPKYEIETKHISMAKPAAVSGFPKVLCGGNILKGDSQAPVSGNHELYGDMTPRVIFKGNGYYGVEFGTTRFIDRVDVWFYENTTDTVNAYGEKVPQLVRVECLSGGQWMIALETESLMQHRNTLQFSGLPAEAVRVSLSGEVMAVYGFKAFNTRALTGLVCSSSVPNSLTLDYFEVKLRKEINGNYNPLGDLIARVYTLDEKGMLDQCLLETIIPKDEVVSGGITKIPVNLSGLVSNRKYALALGQAETAKSRTEGDYYRWIGGHTGYDQTFAIYTDGETRPSDYNWGTAWLRVYCEGICADYSHDSEHVGTRFGLKDMQFRYMTFDMPDSVSTLTDGIAAPGSGYRLSDEILSIDLKGRSANAMNIWVDRPGSLMVNGVNYTIQPGFNEIKQAFNDGIEIKLESGALTVYELEILA